MIGLRFGKLYRACTLASPVTFLTGGHVAQIAFGQISPSASSTRDLGTRLGLKYSLLEKLLILVRSGTQHVAMVTTVNSSITARLPESCWKESTDSDTIWLTRDIFFHHI